MARRSEEVRNGPGAATEAAVLYDQDFYAWTQAQAQALRTHFQGDKRIDVEQPKQCPYDWAAVTERDVMAEGGFGLSAGDEVPPKKRRRKGKS